MHIPNIARNTVLLTFGLLGLVHETVIRTGPERPVLIGAFLALCGLPAFLKADEKSSQIQEKKELTAQEQRQLQIEAAKQLIREGLEADMKRGKYSQ